MRIIALVCALLLAMPGTLLADSAQADMLVHAGDHLNVQITGETDLSQTVTVADDGTIGLPLVGQVRVAGVTPGGASDAIAIAFKTLCPRSARQRERRERRSHHRADSR